jgi:hypothetical protein
MTMPYSLGHDLQCPLAATDCCGSLHQPPVKEVFLEDFSTVPILADEMFGPNEHSVELQSAE